MTDTPRDWKPLQKAQTLPPTAAMLLHVMHTHGGLTKEQAEAVLATDLANTETWINDLYQVQVRPLPNNIVHLNIRRRDGKAIMRDWRHFQAIKNQLVGPECEAIELYPAESRLVDASNKYHLFAVADPTFRFPVGMEQRDVDYSDTAPDVPGMRQRPL